MSARLTRIVWDHFDGPQNELVVLLALADYANENADNIYPSIKELAAKARLKERACQQNLNTLIKQRGFVEIVANKGGGRPGLPQHYRIRVDCIKASAPHFRQRMQSTAPVRLETGALEDRDGCIQRQRRVHQTTGTGALECTQIDQGINQQIDQGINQQIDQGKDKFPATDVAGAHVHSGGPIIVIQVEAGTGGFDGPEVRTLVDIRTPAYRRVRYLHPDDSRLKQNPLSQEIIDILWAHAIALDYGYSCDDHWRELPEAEREAILWEHTLEHLAEGNVEIPRREEGTGPTIICNGMLLRDTDEHGDGTLCERFRLLGPAGAPYGDQEGRPTRAWLRWIERYEGHEFDTVRNAYAHFKQWAGKSEPSGACMRDDVDHRLEGEAETSGSLNTIGKTLKFTIRDGMLLSDAVYALDEWGLIAFDVDATGQPTACWRAWIAENEGRQFDSKPEVRKAFEEWKRVWNEGRADQTDESIQQETKDDAESSSGSSGRTAEDNNGGAASATA